ncbi:MAG TPA: hypothetical protein DGT21_14535 [Armatimonadetes bacterium]|jgi:hypothetical protein|nr:hypothetical protein [Armatimonadota bacterium]
MKAGFASADITPSIGMERPGGFRKAFHEAIHDPCCAKACVIEAEGAVVALVGLDTLSVKRSVVEAARATIERKTGIAGANVLVGSSHTHSGGPTVGARPGEFAHASDPELCEYLAREHSTAADVCYLEHVAGQIATAVIEAWRTRQDALLSVGRGEEPTVAFNRRFIMKDGVTSTHPGKGNPDIIGPAGPVDPEVGVLGAWTADGEFLGCVVNFTCHGTTGNPGASADWIHWMRRAVTGGMGGGEVVFLNGACGDVTQVDNLSLQERESGEKWSRRVGQKVGAEALKILAMAEPAELLPVAAGQTLLEIHTREVSRERYEEALALWQSDAPEDHNRWFARETILLYESNRAEPRVSCEVQAVQVGPAVYLANPAEYFCQFGLNIKERSQFPFTWVVELANGCIGYVPTEDAFGPNGGGYEVRLAMSSKLVKEAGKAIEDASVELAGTLTPGELPQAPQSEVSTTRWGMSQTAKQA